MLKVARGEDTRFIRLIWATLALGLLVGALLAPDGMGGGEASKPTNASTAP